jgi:ribosomal protein S18 acetylase RimI-like enzyme
MAAVTVKLITYTRDSPLLDEALRVYARVWPRRDPAVAREGFTRYAGYRDFHGFVAVQDDVPVGVGYGARSYPGVPWHDLVAPVLEESHPALRDAWRLVELAVIEEHRRQGIGGRLHDALLAAQPCPRALLSTSVANQRARAMYERRGWQYVHRDLAVEGEPLPYVIMSKELVAAAG